VQLLPHDGVRTAELSYQGAQRGTHLAVRCRGSTDHAHARQAYAHARWKRSRRG
jgi:hypothetical protein